MHRGQGIDEGRPDGRGGPKRPWANVSRAVCIWTDTATRSGQGRTRNLDGHGHEIWTGRHEVDVTGLDAAVSG